MSCPELTPEEIKALLANIGTGMKPLLSAAWFVKYVGRECEVSANTADSALSEDSK
jgi:hypothetical protein